MEANIVVKADDLTPDFADGIRKVFSRNAVLHIKVEYNISGPEVQVTNRRGPKPKATVQASTPGKKRGRKPGPKPAMTEAPKKRGPKPKNPIA